MNYFVTGATGFIGKFLLEKLLEREDSKVYVPSSRCATAIMHGAWCR